MPISTVQISCIQNSVIYVSSLQKRSHAVLKARPGYTKKPPSSKKGSSPYSSLNLIGIRLPFLYCLSLSLSTSILPRLLFACTNSTRTTVTITKTNTSRAIKHDILFLQHFTVLWYSDTYHMQKQYPDLLPTSGELS